MDLSPGTHLGPYEILGLVGSGGMGQVYRARDPRLDRDVAIKVLPASFASDPDRIRRFEQEARAVGRLNHPHIVSVYDVGRVPDGLPAAGAPFLVSELLEGRTLRDEANGRALSWRTALLYAREIADGLAAAHDKSVVHRDIKPENLFVTRDGHIKILDFGLAKLRPDGEAETAIAGHVTGPGVVMGTAAYMSPEQVRGQDADHRSDVFSFGSVLYEMLSGRRAFPGATGAETMGAILHVDPAPMSIASVDPARSGAIERIVRRCLEKTPERRFQSARDLAFSFEALTDGSETSAPMPLPRTAAPARSWRAPVLVAGLAALGVAGWLLWPRGTGSAPPAGASPAPPSVMPFLSGPGIETLPAWSPTANLIAYVSDASGNDDVWMTDLTGSNPINLTKGHPGVDTYPAWAPDGQHVAFYSDRDGGGIYTMTPLGANVRRIASVRSSVVYTFSLQWANDDSIVYTNFVESGEKEIYRVSLRDPNPVCLTCGRSTAGARAGALSPSGKLLAFVGGLMGPRPNLYVLHLGSNRIVQLADRADAPRWRDDGHLMFISARDGLPDLWEIAVDPASGVNAGEPVRVTSGLDVMAFAASADGRQILAVKERTSSSVFTFPTDAPRIDSLSQGRAITTGDFRDERPRWSGDGREVFFESNRRGSINVWKVAASGGEPVRLTTGVGLESRPRPSPNGRWVVFDKDGNWAWLMAADGSNAREPVPWRDRYRNVCCAGWSPDSKRITLSVVTNEGQGGLLPADLDPVTGAFTVRATLELPGTYEEYARWSPDSRAIAYEAFTDGSFNVWVTDPEGKSPRQLTSMPGNERSAAWQTSPLVLYFRDERTVWRVPMTDAFTPAGPALQWLAIPGMRAIGDGIDISQDSKQLIVALARPQADIWMVERK